MPSGKRYRQYAEECLRSAQGATPVQRAHLLRVARTWLEIADQTDAWDGDEDTTRSLSPRGSIDADNELPLVIARTSGRSSTP